MLKPRTKPFKAGDVIEWRWEQSWSRVLVLDVTYEKQVANPIWVYSVLHLSDSNPHCIYLQTKSIWHENEFPFAQNINLVYSVEE